MVRFQPFSCRIVFVVLAMDALSDNVDVAVALPDGRQPQHQRHMNENNPVSRSDVDVFWYTGVRDVSRRVPSLFTPFFSESQPTESEKGSSSGQLRPRKPLQFLNSDASPCSSSRAGRGIHLHPPTPAAHPSTFNTAETPQSPPTSLTLTLVFVLNILTLPHSPPPHAFVLSEL